MIQFIKKLFKTRYVYRSAQTGEFVSKQFAKAYPERTVRERIR